MPHIVTKGSLPKIKKIINFFYIIFLSYKINPIISHCSNPSKNQAKKKKKNLKIHHQSNPSPPIMMATAYAHALWPTVSYLDSTYYHPLLFCSAQICDLGSPQMGLPPTSDGAKTDGDEW